MTAATALDLRTFPEAPGADADGGCASVELDLYPALSVLGFFDGVYIVINNLPARARLSAGRCNADFSWSLLPDELTGLRLLPATTEPADCVLTVSIVTPDPLGYEYASTSAQFHVFVSGGVSTVPFNSLRRVDAAPHGSWTGMVQRARNGQASRKPEAVAPMATAPSDLDKRLAAARAEWQAEEDMRLERARVRWESDAEAALAQRAAALAERLEQIQRDRETRWKEREGEIIAANDAVWSARLAASEIRMRADEKTRIATTIAQLQDKARSERWRLAAGWLLFTFTIGSMVLA